MECKNHPGIAEGLQSCSRCGEAFCPDCLIEIGGHPYCALCKGEQLKDMRSGVDSTQLELASLGRRFGALFIDGLIMAIPALVVFFTITFLFFGNLFVAERRTNLGITPAQLTTYQLVIAILSQIPFFLYEAIMLSSNGQTIGKRSMKIKVVTPEGNNITAKQAWIRATVRMIFASLGAIISLVALINYIPAFFGKHKKACVHDSIAKTRVIKVG